MIRANTTPTKPSNSADAFRSLPKSDVAAASGAAFVSEADRIAAEMSEHAIRRGGSAAWIGLDWLGDAEVFQLVCHLGPISTTACPESRVFLAAHAAVTKHAPSAELALAALSHLRRKLKDRNAARFARSLGIGGATGLGSLVYALTVMSKSLDDDGPAGRCPCRRGSDDGRPDRGRQAARRASAAAPAPSLACCGFTATRKPMTCWRAP